MQITFMPSPLQQPSGVKEISFKKFIEYSRSDRSKQIQEQIDRSPDKYDFFKSTLPGFIFSGVFTYRNDKSLRKDSYTGLMCFDIDQLEDYNPLLKHLTKHKHTFSAWPSPSKKGIRLLCKVLSTPDLHNKDYDNIARKFEHVINDFMDGKPFKMDFACKNISRFFYLSHIDSSIVFNENAEVINPDVFCVAPQKKQMELQAAPVLGVSGITDEDKLIDDAIQWVNDRGSFSKGNRDAYTYLLANVFNRKGISRYTALNYVSQNCVDMTPGDTFTQNDAEKKVNNVYDQFPEQHNTNKYNSKLKMQKVIKEIKKDVISTLKPVKEKVVKAYLFQRSEKGAIKNIDIEYLHRCMKDVGIGTTKFNGQVVFYKIKDNTVEFIDHGDFICQAKMISNDLVSSTDNFILTGPKFLEKKIFCMSLMPHELNLFEPKVDRVHFFFKNKVVLVYKNTKVIKEYSDLDFLVLKSLIIDRDYRDTRSEKDSDISKFIDRMGGGYSKHLKSVVGYFMHGKRNYVTDRAVILTDGSTSKISKGGTGKSLFADVIRKMLPVFSLNGRRLDFKNAFVFDGYKHGDRVVFFDDLKRNFDIENLYADLTDGLTVTYKGKGTFQVAKDINPKFLMTSNTFIKSMGNAANRRKYEIKVSDYYNANLTPFDEFGMLFEGWTDAEWDLFHLFIINCAKTYLNNGLITIDGKENLDARVMAMTSNEFMKYTTVKPLSGRFYPIVEYMAFNQMFGTDNGFGNKTVTINSSPVDLDLFSNWISYYLELHNIKYDSGFEYNATHKAEIEYFEIQNK